jgi:hypothetical protein
VSTKDTPESNPHAFRVVRADDVSVIKAVTQLGRMFYVWLLLLVALFGIAIRLAWAAGQVPTKTEVTSAVDFERHVANEDARWNRLDPQLDKLREAIDSLSRNVAVLGQRVDDTGRRQ